MTWIMLFAQCFQVSEIFLVERFYFHRSALRPLRGFRCPGFLLSGIEPDQRRKDEQRDHH